MSMQMIQNDKLTVTVDSMGAALWSIQDDRKREYLWQGDVRYWKDRAPNLFPYIARLTDKRYTAAADKTQDRNQHRFNDLAFIPFQPHFSFDKR